MTHKGEKSDVTKIEDKIIAARAPVSQGRYDAANVELDAALKNSERIDKREPRLDPSLRRKKSRR